MVQKIWDSDLDNLDNPLDKHINWGGDPRTNNLPLSGRCILNLVKGTLDKKAGEFYYYDGGLKPQYYIFADKESRILYFQNPSEHSNLLLAVFDAPANYVAEIELHSDINTVILSGKTGNYINYTFKILKEGQPTGDSVVASYVFNNSGNTLKITQIYSGDIEEVNFLVDPYLKDGVNSINITITGRNTLATTMITVSYRVVALKISSNFNFSIPIEGDYIEFPYTIKGNYSNKYIEWYIDGNKLEQEDYIADIGTTNKTKNISTNGLLLGKHNLQVRAYIKDDSNETKYYSSTLYFDFVISSDGTFTLLGLELSEPIETTPSITIALYFNFNYKLAVYDSLNRVVNLLISDNETQVQNILMSPEEYLELTYTPMTVGEHTILFSAENDSSSITMNVEAGEININEVTDDLLLKLSAKNRSNTESNRDTWVYNNITTTFNNFVWNKLSGWNNGTLIIPIGSSIDINFLPLNGNPVTNGRTIEIDYETINIIDDNASIINLTNLNGAGLSLTASSAKLQSLGGANVNTKYKDGDRIHLAFIINRTVGDDARLMYIINNGIPERSASFNALDSFQIPGNLHIGSTGCTVKIHSIRVYDKALTFDLAFSNYAIDSDNLLEIANRNNILTNQVIDVDKVNSKIPVMVITGDISPIMSISLKELKNTWNTYPVKIEFHNLEDPSKDFVIEQADIRLQGTTSVSYPRKNFRIYSNSKNGGSGKYNTIMKDGEGNEIEGGKYALRDNSAPVTCWCLKADYAESSGSHNTGTARLWNELMYNVSFNPSSDGELIDLYGLHPLRTKAQLWADENNYPYDVRTTIDGFPIVLFHRETEQSPLVCFGQYNFNNDKSTEEVFGFTALTKGEQVFDNSKVQCWECVDSDKPSTLFTDLTDFDKDLKNKESFESRYPSKNSDPEPLKDLAIWINSCKNNLFLWETEKKKHFDLPKLCAYYVYLIRFGAVDLPVKNSMLTTEDGKHWYFINYDNDTIFGIDNSSHIFNAWDFDFDSLTPNGGYYYAGKNKSVLWNCFRNDTECMNLVRKIDLLLYNAGLTYTNLCRVYDLEQTNKWCERLYAENGRYKYIESFKEGNNVLYMLHGSRESYRHWWLQHRLEKFDNQWGTGSYRLRTIQVRSSSDKMFVDKALYEFVPAITSYFGCSLASTEIDPPTLCTENLSYLSGEIPSTSVGNYILIYNANNLKEINLSVFANALEILNITGAVGINGESNLKSLILGDGITNNNYLTGISGLLLQTQLEELDIRKYLAMQNIENLSELINLLKFNAEGSGLTSFVPAEGITLKQVSLPSGLNVLLLKDVVIENLSYTPTSNLRVVSLRNVTMPNHYNFVMSILNSHYTSELQNLELTLEGINWRITSTELEAFLAKYEQIENKQNIKITGKITLNTINLELYDRIISDFGNSVFRLDGQLLIDCENTVDLVNTITGINLGEFDTLHWIHFPIINANPQNTKYTVPGASTIIEDGEKVYLTSVAKVYENSGKILALVDYTLTTNTTLSIVCKNGPFQYNTSVVINKAILPNFLQLTTINPNNILNAKTFVNFSSNILPYTFKYYFVERDTEVLNNDSYLDTGINFDNNYPYNYNSIQSITCRLELYDDSTTLVDSSIAEVSINTNERIITLNVHLYDLINLYKLRVFITRIDGREYECTWNYFISHITAIKFNKEIAMTRNSENGPIIDYMYQQGWVNDTNVVYVEELNNITDSLLEASNGFLNLLNYNSTVNFSFLKYFTSITNIPEKCFYCQGLNNTLTTILTNLELPPQIISVGDDAFNSIMINSDVIIPDNVIRIGKRAFANSIASYRSSLSNVKGNVTIGTGTTSIDDEAFARCFYYPNSGITFPSTINNFGNYIIRENSSEFRGNITINCNLPNRNNSQSCIFDFVGGYRTITINSTSIGNNTIEGSGINIKLSKSIQHLGSNWLVNNYNSWIKFNTSEYNFSSMLNHIKIGNGNFDILNLPNSLTYIGEKAFAKTATKSITFPDNNVFNTIPSKCLSECYLLESITIPSNVNLIDSYAFEKCYKIQEINFEGLSAPTMDIFSFTPEGDGTLSSYAGVANRWSVAHITIGESDYDGLMDGYSRQFYTDITYNPSIQGVIRIPPNSTGYSDGFIGVLCNINPNLSFYFSTYEENRRLSYYNDNTNWDSAFTLIETT